jgi:hypothetical protein
MPWKQRQFSLSKYNRVAFIGQLTPRHWEIADLDVLDSNAQSLFSHIVMQHGHLLPRLPK